MTAGVSRDTMLSITVLPSGLNTALLNAEPMLRRLAERMCENSGDASDLVQDTFERALRRGISPEIRSTNAWLTTIMRNLSRNHRRDAARKPDHETFEDSHGQVTRFEPDALPPAWSRITVQDIRDALTQIKPLYRDVYELHTFGHLSYAQVAQRLSIQRRTVGTRLTRARHQLRDVLVRRFGLEDPEDCR
jgi:RNA polymerase sigma-70 factor (ECF subfamily)